MKFKQQQQNQNQKTTTKPLRRANLEKFLKNLKQQQQTRSKYSKIGQIGPKNEDFEKMKRLDNSASWAHNLLKRSEGRTGEDKKTRRQGLERLRLDGFYSEWSSSRYLYYRLEASNNTIS